jgi:hypothetical protein
MLSFVPVRLLWLQVIDHRDESFFFLVVCILDVFGHFVGSEDRRN